VAGDEMKLLKDIEKVTRQKIPMTDRRNDKALQALDASIMASGVAAKATLPEREPRRGDGEGNPRNRNRNRRNEQRSEGGGQPHRIRKGERRGEQAPRPAPTYNPMAGENTTPREPKPVSEMKRRPRKRPSNGGKGFANKG